MTFLLIALELIGLAAVLHVLLSGKRPLSMLIWIGILLLLPGLGLLTYLLIGSDRVRRRRFKRHRHQVDDRIGDARSPEPDLQETDCRLLSAVSRLCRHPITSVEGKVTAYYSGSAYYPELMSAIEKAESFIHIEMYLWRNDDTGQRIRDALVAAAKNGVTVRLLVDEIGSIEVREHFFRPIVAAGGRFSWFYTVHPRRNRYFFNLRNHRKMVIIDGRLAFIGGINIGGEYEGRDPSIGKWKDLQIRIQGDVVNQLQEVFRHDWHFATEEEIDMTDYYQDFGGPGDSPAVIVESGPDTKKGVALNSLLAMIGQAARRIDLFTPYFVPEPGLVSALQIAAAKGVDVRLMVSKKNDFQILVDIARSFYDELLDSGVAIYEYDRAMNHAKLAVADGKWVLAGSANLDARSMHLNFEVGILLKSSDLCRQMAAHLEALFADAAVIEPERFAKRSTYQRLKQGALRLLAPLL